MDPIRNRARLPPPTPVAGVGPGRHGDPALDDVRAAAPRAAVEGEPAPAAAPTPARRGSVPHRAAEDLARLAAALEAEPADGAESASLRARLAALALDPEGGAEGVRRAAGQGAVALRVALLAASAELRPSSLAPALTALAEALARALAQGGAADAELVAAARDALAAGLGRLGPEALPRAAAGAPGIQREHLHALAARLLAAAHESLVAGGSGGGHDALLGRLARVELGSLAQRLGGPVLAVVLALPPESALRSALIAGALDAVRPQSFDARLAVFGELAQSAPGGAVRAAEAELGSFRGSLIGSLIASLIGALESEASANAVRRDAGEATGWTLPVLDGRRWSTVTLLEDRHGSDARDGRRGRDGGGTRVALGTDFSALGPVRADLAVSEERVVLRLVAADPGTAQGLRVAIGELRERLATGAREVQVTVAEGGPAEARVELPPPLMDHLDLRG